MAIVIPTLSTDGFVKDVPRQLDRILTYFITNDVSQTTLYAGEIKSLQFLIYEYSESDLNLRTAVQDTVTQLLERFFDSVTVNTFINDGEVGVAGNYGLRLDAEVSRDGTTYVVGREVTIINSIISTITEAQNG